MIVEKTAFCFEGETIEDGLSVCHTILFNGKKWLVPFWEHNDATGKSKPERIICLDLLAHQKSDGALYHYLLNQPMPRGAFDGHVQPPSKGIFLIVEHPLIEIDTRQIFGDQN
jgi:hypothetical protein